jgi:aminoglycoside phosphotransferase (APT) family kinase protein
MVKKMAFQTAGGSAGYGPQPLTNLAEARARQVLRACGLPSNVRLIRADSTRNEVFLTDTHAIRLNRSHNDRLRREAALCRALADALPEEPWVPTVVAYGGGAGKDYLIVARKSGTPLARWWPDMDRPQRRDAVRQFAHCLKAIHEVPTPSELPRLGAPPQPLCRVPGPVHARTLQGLRELRQHPFVDDGLVADVKYRVDQLADSVTDFDESQLIHGDLTFENVLWDGSHITAVLDFEWCRGAPRDLDLDVLLRFARLPKAHVAADYEHRTRARDYRDVGAWLVEDYPTLFDHPRLAERLQLFALAFEVQALTRTPPTGPRSTLGPLHPYNRLVDVLIEGGPAVQALRPRARGRSASPPI